VLYPVERRIPAGKIAIVKVVHVSLNANRKEGLINSINESFWMAVDAGWDGHNAKPISLTARSRAIKFFKDGFCGNILPDVTPEPDGELALEWYGGQGSVFSISFGESDTVTYAGLYSDKSKIHGVENIDSMDKTIFQRYISRATSN